MVTSGLGHQVGGGYSNSQEGAALLGLVVHDGLLLHHGHAQAELALPAPLAVPVPQHPLHSPHSHLMSWEHVTVLSMRMRSNGACQSYASC